LIWCVQFFIFSLGYLFVKRDSLEEKELSNKERESFDLQLYNFRPEKEKQYEANLKLEEQKLQLERKQLLLEAEKAQLEYAFLRSQMNPHTLQNLLNMLVVKAMKASSPDLGNAIINLSAIMRYSMDVKTDEKGRVPLEGEIQHMHNILKMQEFRTKQTNCVEIKTEGDVKNARIIPLVIIPFIENAIKYAELNDPENPLQIHISVKENDFTFFTRNKIKAANSVLEEGSTSHGIGLANTRQRLNASYHADGYDLQLQKTGDFFSVTLQIFDLNRQPKIIVSNLL
jgi:sensor histidine kinase YesM